MTEPDPVAVAAEPAAGGEAQDEAAVAAAAATPDAGETVAADAVGRDVSGAGKPASNGAGVGPVPTEQGDGGDHVLTEGGSEADGDDGSAADSEGTQDFSDDDDEGKDGYKKGGYHPVKLGEIYNNDVVVVRKLGWGHFSTVWCAWDRKRSRQVALKVQKSASHYTEAAMDEIEFLHKAASIDHPGSHQVVRLWDSFKHEGPHGKHVCMVFEPMGPNLLALIKHYHYRGIPMEIVRTITRQVLEGLDFLHTQCSIIHTGRHIRGMHVCSYLSIDLSTDPW